MFGARSWTSQRLGSRRLARPQQPARLARSLANNLTLTIVLVALFASFAIAASSSSWQQEYPQRGQLLNRVADRLANLDDRAIVNDLRERDARDEIEADDEQFLRHLKQAAEYLEAKMAGEPHEKQQQPVSVDFENMAAGPLAAPRYELLDNRDNNLNERYQYALPVGQQAGDLVDSAADDNQAGSEPKANLINYLLMLDKDRETESTDAQQQEEAAKTIVSLGAIGNQLEAIKRQKPRETTLLEDEQGDEQPQESQATTTTTTSVQSTPTSAPYGKVAHTSEEQLAAAKQHQEPPTSIFGRLKANLSYYLPFLSQINILRQPSSEHEKVGSPQMATNETKQQKSDSLTNDSDGLKKNDIYEQQSVNKDSRLQPAKQSVSASKAIKVEPDQPETQLRVKVKAADQQVDLSEDQEKELERQLSGNVRASSTSKRVNVNLADNERDLNDMVEAQQAEEEQRQQGARTISAMRQSNLILPLSDELLVRAEPDDGASGERDSLLGRYIYAPTHHYYLNAPPMRPQATLNQQQQLKPAYAFQKDPGSMLSFAHLIDPTGAAANKSAQSNDLYFLVMVGAFCVMAMAVVLSAGLFAYRVQQQRKASQDTDYPTYGVVGPNNMAGVSAAKSAGAAAFVNGYFGSPLASGKSASAKHLPDLYGQAAAIDSGLEKSLSASISSSHKKNSSSTNSSARTSNNEAPLRTTNGNNLFASTAANQDAARMYHYQHQKQQMIVSDRSSAGRHTSASDLDSDDGDDDGSYTVYECPGLASAHEMEIKNPLFNDDQSP